MTKYKVTATKTTTGMQVSAGTRGFEITFDEPGSTDTGMNPVEILLTSFGACQAITATALAKKRNFDLRAFWVTVEGSLIAKMLLMAKTSASTPKSTTNHTYAAMSLTRTLRSFLPTLPQSVQLKTP